jgi:hypothetical protein
VNFDFAVVFPFPAPASTFAVIDVFIVIVQETTRRRPAALTDGKRNWHIGRRAVFMVLVSLVLFDISVSRHRPAVKRVEGRLSSHELWASRSTRCRLTGFPDINIEVVIYD